MTCRQCVGIERMFDEATARRELSRYRRRGPSPSTRLLLDAVIRQGVRDCTFLDVGGGIGAIQYELLAAGASSGVHADASPAYLDAARSEATRRGLGGRMRYLTGDIVEMGDEAADADVVTLDRVLCCYPHMDAMVDATARRARRVYALVLPRERWLVRMGAFLLNVVQRIRRHPFSFYLHPTAAVEGRVRAHGFEKSDHSSTFLWQVVVFTRPPLSAAQAP